MIEDAEDASHEDDDRKRRKREIVADIKERPEEKPGSGLGPIDQTPNECFEYGEKQLAKGGREEC